MKTFTLLSNKRSKLPKQFKRTDDRYPEALVKLFLQEYTRKGDKVIDIFAGLGTTLISAEKIGRIPFGIEKDAKRFEYIQSNLKNKQNVINGDSLKLNKHKFPKFDFCITSPPYMARNEMNPFRLKNKAGYQTYLNDLKKIFSQLKLIIKKNAYVVIEVSNLKGEENTTLAWDIANQISKTFHFENEVVIGWKDKGGCPGAGNYGYGYDHSYCLVFKNK